MEVPNGCSFEVVAAAASIVDSCRSPEAGALRIGRVVTPVTQARAAAYRYSPLVRMKTWLSACLFLLCGCLCIGGAACSTSTVVRRCIRTADAELCGNRTAAGIVLEAKGLKPGSTVKLSSAATGSTEATVGPSGHLEGTVGLGSDVAVITVVAVTASTATGEPLAGELAFPKP